MFKYSNYDAVALPLAFLIMVIITVICLIFLKNKTDTIKRIPLKIITVILVVLEVIKQVRNVIVGFDFYALPLHYCSLFVFFFPIAEFGSEKLRKFFFPVAFITAFTMSALFYFSPNSIIGSSSEFLFNDFSHFHSFTFHHLVILYVILTIALKLYKPTKNDFKYLMIVMVIYVTLVIPFSHIVNTNYCNFLYSVLPPMEFIRVTCGQFIYSLVMFLVVGFGPSVVAILYRLVYDKITKKASD